MKQTEMVLNHLQTRGSITPLEAQRDYGIMRLGARIWDLKRAGHRIITEIERGENRHGVITHWARYRMKCV